MQYIREKEDADSVKVRILCTCVVGKPLNKKDVFSAKTW